MSKIVELLVSGFTGTLVGGGIGYMGGRAEFNNAREALRHALLVALRQLVPRETLNEISGMSSKDVLIWAISTVWSDVSVGTVTPITKEIVRALFLVFNPPIPI